MKSSTDTTDRSGSAAIAAPHLVRLETEVSEFADGNSYLVQLSSEPPADGDREGAVIHEMPQRSRSVDVRKAA